MSSNHKQQVVEPVNNAKPPEPPTVTLIQRLLSRQVLLFLGVGGSATALQFIFLVLMVELLGTHKVMASAVAYALSAAYNYLLNYYLTFGSRQSHWRTLPKFFVVVCVGLSVNTLVFAAALTLLPYIVAQFLAVIVALIVNFALHKYWIYRREQ